MGICGWTVRALLFLMFLSRSSVPAGQAKLTQDLGVGEHEQTERDTE